MMEFNRNVPKAGRRAGIIVQVFIAAVLAVGALAPATARADDDAGPPDARLTGFPKPVDNGGGSTATAWIFLIFLGVIAMSTLFKDAKRTHLD